MSKDHRLRHSQAQEARGAALHEGKRNPGSGNGMRKHDVRLDREALIEYKATKGTSITVKTTDLERLRMGALLEGREPVWGIELGGRDWVLIEAEHYQALRDAARRATGGAASDP